MEANVNVKRDIFMIYYRKPANNAIPYVNPASSTAHIAYNAIILKLNILATVIPAHVH